MTELRRRIRADLDRTLADLASLVRIPSVSAQGTGIAEAAQAVRDLFAREDAGVAVLQGTGANPCVVARFPGQSDRTLLFYDHYDVQPPDPLEEWETPPFDLVVRDGNVYGRGVADNKGDLVSRVAAIRALRAERGTLPCAVTFVVEGEEEISSAHFGAYVRAHAELLRADACVWEYGERDHQGRLHVVPGVKGICYVELAVEGLTTDLHSSLGAILEGAAFRLVWALATLKDPASGRVRIPGFYDDVEPPGEAALEVAGRVPFDPESYLQRSTGRQFLGGADADQAKHDLYFEPTCSICGITSGYAGPGSKTVLPRRAMAKVDFRLVPGQSPERVVALLRAHLDRQGFADVQIQPLGAERAYRSDLRHPFVGLVASVAERVTGRPAVVTPNSAGTGPMWDVGTSLGIPIVSVGAGYWGSRAHAPNEHLRLRDYEETVELIARLIEQFAA